MAWLTEPTIAHVVRARTDQARRGFAGPLGEGRERLAGMVPGRLLVRMPASPAARTARGSGDQAAASR